MSTRPSARRRTFHTEGLLGEYLAELQADGQMESSLTKKRSEIRAAESLLGVPLEEATERQVRTWWLSIAGLKPRTRANRLSHVRGYALWLVAGDHRLDDPTRKLNRPRIPRGVPRDLDTTKVSEAVTAAAGTDPQVALALQLQHRLGLRDAETAQVRPTRDVVHRDGQPYLRILGKGGNERILPLPTELAALLAPIRGWAFPSARTSTGHASPKWIGGKVRDALRDVGLDGAVAHQLRHTAATNLQRLTGDITVTGEFLGHASLTSTQVYARGAGVTHDLIERMYAPAIDPKDA